MLVGNVVFGSGLFVVKWVWSWLRLIGCVGDLGVMFMLCFM